MESDTLVDALSWIRTTTDRPWPTDAVEAMLELAVELDIDRVIVTSPGQITVRVADADKRIRFQFRHRGQKDAVRVIGLTDDLGRVYSVTLRVGEIDHIRRPRRR